MPETDGERGAPAPWAMDLRGTTAPALVGIRRWASRALAHVGDDHLGDVLLVATELVTNAYDHGKGPVQVRMSRTARPCRVRIEVEDNCLEHPVVVTPSADTPGGRGMQIVAKLAAAWGVREHRASGGKTVWAEVPCDGAEG
ncbi:anti-sigma regulatory factor (Ser/Thr protein kinase) [Amycolatopsis lexingtonensis]|uniref:Anti-sigma regulatory factor (Ser/Thr protein kinase) n=1 Tax=Amycolatopsis lexingtonensis TaxID=218822 RepID=A0ABR9HY51_9PSEU|nr:ATP-binding protein [Amycolatopsis lexingtonensis]MBE1495850.1 anti-sigma regulatory factor (Ser/Thr protein kinase) [Amycolatopsis lexingtonensis]